MMPKNQDPEPFARNLKLRKKYFIFLLALVLGVIFIIKLDLFEDKEHDNNMTIIENGIHVQTGLKEGEGLEMVIANCTGCHSAQLVIQNRMDKEHWNATIRWMQETQNLWDLGENQEVIVNYLVSNYPVIDKGRRANLEHIEWYELKKNEENN